MPVIAPTVGRNVHYHPDAGDHINYVVGQPLLALIAHVNKDGTVNLAVFDYKGAPTSRLNVPLYQGEGPIPSQSYASWMDYQRGQAAKTEQLEAQLASRGADGGTAGSEISTVG